MISKVKLTTGFVTAAFLAAVVLPSGAFAANTVTVSGNGADSHNKVKIKSNKKTKVKQSNSTAVVNMVGVMQNTGGNKANKNTGNGGVSVDSGNATATVTNTTTTGGNHAVVNPCDCVEGDNTIDVKNNGADSTNKVKVVSNSTYKVSQSNETFVMNGVLVAQNTGMNQANQNTGDGEVGVDSGAAEATVTNEVATEGNVLNP